MLLFDCWQDYRHLVPLKRFFSLPPFFHCICSEEIRDIPNSFLNDLLSVSLTVRPLLVTETTVHEDEHIVCHPSFVFLYFSPHFLFYVMHVTDFFSPYVLASTV